MGERILVVDDESMVLSVFQQFLTREGYRVETAESYGQAMAALTAGGFDLVFCDIMLEDKSGLDLLRACRGLGWQGPVVMVTGYPDIQTVTEALRLGAHDYLAKPVHLEQLLRVTHQALRQEALRRENMHIRGHLEAIFRSVQDAVITIDPEQRVTALNQAAEGMFHTTREQAQGQPLDVLFNECAESCMAIFRECVSSPVAMEIPRQECHRCHKPWRVLNVRSAPLLDDQQRPMGGILVIKDETRLVQLERIHEERRQFHRLVGKSAAMQRLYQLIENLAETQTSVLIQGESGTGKELVAEAIHRQSSSRDAPLIKVNCAALAETLLESELFGHVKGAFTGAVRDKVGRFEAASGGTIFLDEIGDISPRMQLRLLRVLQEKEIERVGDSRTIKVEFRLIAATNAHLRRKVREGGFREDLFYRLNVVTLDLPPLRQRLEDLPLLVDFFVERFNRQFQKSLDGISHQVRALFMNHTWPGNVRELEHTLEHAFIVCREGVICVEHLPRDLVEEMNGQPAPDPETALGPPEAERILQALEQARWNRTEAAKLLGISRRTIYRWMERLGIGE